MSVFTMTAVKGFDQKCSIKTFAPYIGKLSLQLSDITSPPLPFLFFFCLIILDGVMELNPLPSCLGGGKLFSYAVYNVLM